MTNAMLYISHASALHYWRTNPPWYMLEGKDRNIRSLRNCPSQASQVDAFDLPEIEFGPEPVDVLVPRGAYHHNDRLRYHTASATLPPHSLYPLRDGIHVVSPELCLVQACASLPFIEALETGMELCGTYALRPNTAEGMARRDYTLVQAAQFKRHVNSWKGMRGIDAARKVAVHIADGAASPMETKLYLLLCLPQKYGGYNLPKPELNPELDLSENGKLLLRHESASPDMLWRGDGINLIVEYDGSYHEGSEQDAADRMRESILVSMGYTVVRIRRQQLYNPLAFDGVVQSLAKLLGKRMRTPTLGQLHTRNELRRQLLGD